ncbi:MAG: DUF72 domain-containing protein, partial [Methanobacteriota archaeon]
MIVVGTCGFGQSRARTFRDLEAVEVQETFHRRVEPERARAWRASAPPAFVFAVRASRTITHTPSFPTYRRAGRSIASTDVARFGGFQDTAPVRAGWEATRAVAEALRAAAVVFETPPSFGPTEAHVAALYRFFGSIET